MGHIELTCFDSVCQEEGAITTELDVAYGILSRKQSTLTIERRVGIWLKKALCCYGHFSSRRCGKML